MYKNVADGIDADRQQSLAKAESAAADARRDPSLLPPFGRYGSAMHSLLRRMGRSETPEQEFLERVSILQTNIDRGWRDRSLNGLSALFDLDWRKDH